VLRGAPGCRSLQSMYTNCAFTTASPQPESSLGVYTTLAEASCVCQDLGKLFIDPPTDPNSKQMVVDGNHKYTALIRYDESLDSNQGPHIPRFPFIRFLWFQEGRLNVLQLTSLPFGTASSPFMLHTVLSHLI